MKKLFVILLLLTVFFISGCSKDDSVSNNILPGVTPQVTLFSKSGLLDSIYCSGVNSYKIDNLASFKIDTSKKYVINYKVDTDANALFAIAKNIYGVSFDTVLYWRDFHGASYIVNDTVKPLIYMNSNMLKYIIAVNVLYKYISIRDLKVIMLY
ncbi:MAG: hypothetical protein HY959_14150 [Ignavibacteriae bacterium]|nr:hypothetical protein [Ignavibacteriota bacterium]